MLSPPHSGLDEIILLHQWQSSGFGTAWSVFVQSSPSVYASPGLVRKVCAKGRADMCRPAVQSSYEVSYTNRARHDNGGRFARLCFVPCSFLPRFTECEPEQFGHRRARSSEAGEGTVLPGEARSTTTDIITYIASQEPFPCEQTLGIAEVFPGMSHGRGKQLLLIASNEPAVRPVALPQIDDTSPLAVTALPKFLRPDCRRHFSFSLRTHVYSVRLVWRSPY